MYQRVKIFSLIPTTLKKDCHRFADIKGTIINGIKIDISKYRQSLISAIKAKILRSNFWNINTNKLIVISSLIANFKIDLLTPVS